MTAATIPDPAGEAEPDPVTLWMGEILDAMGA